MELDKNVIPAIHNHTIDILNRREFRFGSPQALAVFKKHGFKIVEDIVYFTGDQVESALASVPSEVTILARDPQHDLKLTLDRVAFGLGRGAIYVLDKRGGHRRSVLADLVAVSKLAQQLPEVQHWQPLVLPGDIPEAHVTMAFTQTMIAYQTKPDLVAGIKELEMLLLAFGGLDISHAREMAGRGFSYGQATVNVMSPLTLPESDCRALIEFADIGVATQITPMPLAGSTAPCTLLGVVIQQNCEVLAPLVLSQLINPGCCILYGNMASGSDMRTMGGSFGSPESRLIELIAGRVAKHYNLLSRGGIGTTDASFEGFQAGAEALFQAHNAVASGSNLAIGMGFMGGLMAGSLVKVMLDAELVNYVRSFNRSIELSAESTAEEIIAGVPFDGNYIVSPHTLAHCRREHYAPSLFERKTPDAWQAGAHDAFLSNADRKVKEMLAAYVRPEMDRDLARELKRSFARYLPESLLTDRHSHHSQRQRKKHQVPQIHLGQCRSQ